MEDPKEPQSFDRLEAALEIRRSIRDITAEVAVDVLVYTESAFERLASVPSFVRGEIIRGGKTVYASGRHRRVVAGRCRRAQCGKNGVAG
jgi:hypothetical protein